MNTPNPAPEPATNWYGTRRHLSTDLYRDPYSGNRGRRGLSLCSTEGNPVGVRDQDWLAGMAPSYPHLGRIVIADLPACKKCARKVGEVS